MDNNFREQITKQLVKLTHTDICLFAWLCAVRALPFLGAKGNFDYWRRNKKEDNRQKHLLSVLRVLDMAYIYSIAAADATTDAATTADAAADNAYTAAITAAAIAAVDAYTAARATYTAARAAYTAAYTATKATTADAVAAAVVATIDAAVVAATVAAEIAAVGKQIKIETIILKDLENIKSRKWIFQNDLTIYGEIWSRFMNALYELDCEYWGKWYTDLFNKNFLLSDNDQEEINLRLGVPNEINEQGAAAVARYVLKLKEQGAKRFNETRILILGNKGSGKTSLALRLKDPTHLMPKDNETTEGVDINEWNIAAIPGQADSEVNAHIWDFAGHVITHAAHRCFMTSRCLYILLIDGRTEGDNRTEYWLEQIRNYGGSSPILVLINIKDKHPVEIMENALKKEFPSIIGFYQVDIKNDSKSLEDFRQIVMEILRNNPLWKIQKISIPAYKVKESLRQQFKDSGNEFITRDKFYQIAENHGIALKEQKQLLADLRDLGICLWYDSGDMQEFDAMVLNPGWISYGIYRLINWGLKEKKQVLSDSDFQNAFTDKDAPRYYKKADFLFKLMKKYQLAFFEETNRIFVPLLLSADRTADLTEDKINSIFPFGKRLLMEYSANTVFLMIIKLIARN